MATKAIEQFRQDVFDILHETFEKVDGIFLDRGTSLFETLATISAEEASRAPSPRCATLAAQVEHVRFYIDVIERYARQEKVEGVDWGEIWRTVKGVTPEEWAASQARLQASYERVMALMESFDTWEGESEIGAPLAILAHTAYHLGEIRQALCVIKA